MEHIDRTFVELAEQRGQRFTGRGRLAFRHAEQESEQRGHTSVAAGHLMLGVVRDQNSVAVSALQNLGVRPEALASAAEDLLATTTAAASERMDAELQSAVEAALEEADQLGHTHVGTEHLLLGLLRETAFGRVLEAAGATLEQARAEVVQALENWQHEPGGPVACTTTA